MRFAFATTFDGRNISKWSGTPFHMANAFENEGIDIEYIGQLKRYSPLNFKLKRLWKDLACGQRESHRFNVFTARYYSQQVSNQLLSLDVDAVIAPQINPVAYLESKKPLILWTDGLYASLLGFYPGFSNHSASTIEQGNIITRECLSRCKLAIFSSDWAARTALEIYGTDKDKVKVVPFGANLNTRNTLSDIRTMIKARSHDTIKLLFLGKQWDRKGGDIVFKVVKAMHAEGVPVELNFVGCKPPEGTEIPAYIKCHGFISKSTPLGMAHITKLLRESHFLFVPSRAEAYGIVFCEANAYGLPCLTSFVGGISTIVKDNINGMTFSLDAEPRIFCEYIMELMQDYTRYEALALSAFHEFETRLNWDTAVKTVKYFVQDFKNS
jgi:glycosyltransferase involved in cell wall biosynthesis